MKGRFLTTGSPAKSPKLLIITIIHWALTLIDIVLNIMTISKAMVFPVVMYECESWTIKKAESQRTDAFELWCWRRLLRVPWTPRSNQSILKEINPEYSLQGLMLRLKLQYFGHLMGRAGSLEKTLMLGKIEGRRRREWQRTRWLDGIINSMDMNFSQLQEIVKDRKAWHTADHAVAKSQTWLSDWTTTMVLLFVFYVFLFLQMCTDIFRAFQVVQW